MSGGIPGDFDRPLRWVWYKIELLSGRNMHVVIVILSMSGCSDSATTEEGRNFYICQKSSHLLEVLPQPTFTGAKKV